MRYLMQNDADSDAWSRAVRTTLTIDDELFAKAMSLAEPGMGKSELLKECIKAFIQRQAARRLAALGGQMTDVDLVPRRRDEAHTS